MKKSRIILGLGAVVLAIGGAFTTASENTQPVYYWEVEGSNPQNCTQLNINAACNPSPTPDCRTITPAGDRQLFEDESCSSPLERESGF